jgi:hypothetical protein
MCSNYSICFGGLQAFLTCVSENQPISQVAALPVVQLCSTWPRFSVSLAGTRGLAHVPIANAGPL